MGPDVESPLVPTYAYACTACGHRFDIYQSFSDDALTVCPECGGPLRKQFGNVGVVFKGSGFYRNDARGTTTSSSGPSESSGSTAGADSGSSGSSTSKESGSSTGSGSKDSSSATTSAKPSASSSTSKADKPAAS